jgi:thiosulfate/3-mercaptopyruvate sulfurtransferase
MKTEFLFLLAAAWILLGGFKKESGAFPESKDDSSIIECRQAGQEPWKDSQLMAPADLAALINDTTAKKPLIICVGPGALIRGSINTGPAKEEANLEKLRAELNQLPKDAELVIYCGCCPFEHCPNIRPAFTMLNEMKFTHARLLNIEHNLGKDWVAKGYPQEKK